MKKIFLALAAAVAAAGMMTSCGEKTAATATTENDSIVAPLPDTTVVCILKDDSLLRPDKKVERVTVIDFNATWCQPCRLLAPSFDAVADELHGKADFYSVDVDVNRFTAQAFNVGSIPNITILTPEGKVVSYIGLTLMDPTTKESVISEATLDSIETPEQLTSVVTPAFRSLVEEYISK